MLFRSKEVASGVRQFCENLIEKEERDCNKEALAIRGEAQTISVDKQDKQDLIY